jgi:polysaccharide biosynthesis/export protein
LAINAVFVLGGCAALPAAGPTTSQIEDSATPASDTYVVRVNHGVMEALSLSLESGFPASFRVAHHTPTVALRPGDIISVNVYENSTSPLFGPPILRSLPASPSDANAPSVVPLSTTLPPQIIEPNGDVVIPFVGRVSVIGLTPTQAGERIAARLKSKTVDPQVIVSLQLNSANTVSVGGDVNLAKQVPITLRGERLLDVIAQAGGPRFPAIETDVRLIRGGAVARIPLQQILTSPAQNIIVQPNDTIVLVRNPKTFVVLGAAAKVAQYELDLERVTVAEGLARAGGTLETTGNLSGIYVLRTESAALARKVLVAEQGSATVDRIGRLSSTDVKILYRIDLSQSGGYFFAQNMTLRDKDIVLVANADATQLQKVLTLLRGFTGLYFDIGRNVYVP